MKFFIKLNSLVHSGETGQHGRCAAHHAAKSASAEGKELASTPNQAQKDAKDRPAKLLLAEDKLARPGPCGPHIRPAACLAEAESGPTAGLALTNRVIPTTLAPVLPWKKNIVTLRLFFLHLLFVFHVK